MLRRLHPLAGGLALLTILGFWTSTVVCELFGTPAMIAALKIALPWGLLILVPALALTGASGLAAAAGRRTGLVGKKLGRMPVIAANGLLVLTPSALFLAYKAHLAQLDATFAGVQTLELAAGALNIILLGLSVRDGLKMTGRLRKTPVS